MNPHRCMIGAIATVGLATVFAMGVVQSSQAASHEAIEAGKKDFQRYCSSCHGVGGKGDGPIAPLLTIGAPDLTLLAKWNDGNFPSTRVMEIIDGRAAMAVHGGRGEMPVWGMELSSNGESTAAEGRVLNMTLYLESIQAK